MHRKSKSASKGKTLRQPEYPNDLTNLLVDKILQLRPSIKTDYLKSEFMSKFVSKDTAPADVREAAALRKWLAAEADNEATADRLLLTHEEYNLLPRVTYSRFIQVCQDIILDVIGEVPPEDVLIGSFSGGASTSRNRTQSQPARKYVGKASVTPRCFEYLFSSLEEMCPHWLGDPDAIGLQIDPHPGNAMFTVPKKTDIDRVAAKECDLNMFIQKGIGNYFRNSLRRIGINLNDQSINRSLALRGSIDGSLATLDLSSASDSVTTELVFQLLPVTWYTLLDSVRSHATVLPDGVEHRNHMFSSMGNGFTFELESLIFYALMRATAYCTGTRGIISVYGDDLIIPTCMASDAILVLNYFGFQVNPEKSFVDGDFRESCGGHYRRGIDLTPFYIRKPIESTVDIIQVANQLREWSRIKVHGLPLGGVLDPEVESIWLWLKAMVPRCLWGGGDTSFKYQLASYDVPAMRLQEVTGRVSVSGIGGYLHWLNTVMGRSGSIDEPVETSSFSVSRNRLRIRPVRDKTVPRLGDLFLHEIG